MGPHGGPGLFLPEQSVTGSSWLSEKLELGSGGVNLESEGHVSLSPSLTRPPPPGKVCAGQKPSQRGHDRAFGLRVKTINAESPS